MKYLKYITFAAGLIMSYPVFAVETAQQLIARCAAVVNEAPSVDVAFTLSNVQGGPVKMTMTISKQRFMLDSPQMIVWYDGTTQWTYLKKDKELNITDPTTEELMECNPFAILNYYSSAYTARRLEGEQSVIELVSKDRNASVRKAVVTLDPSTHFPSKVIITTSTGSVMVATVTSITKGRSLPISTFTYDTVKYPANEIIDLR